MAITVEQLGNQIKETNKELVRQRIVRALIHEYGFSPENMENDFSIAIKKAVARAFSLAFCAISAFVVILATITFFIKAVIPDGILAALKFMPFACVIIGLAALISKELPSKAHAGVFILGMTLVLLLTWIL